MAHPSTGTCQAAYIMRRKLKLTACPLAWAGALLAAAPWVGPQPVLGQASDKPWLAVPVAVGEGAGPESDVTGRLARALSATLKRQGQATLSAQEGQQRFLQRGSTAPTQTRRAEIDALEADSQKALYEVASGQHKLAFKTVRNAIARVEGKLDSANRDGRTARRVLDSCLYLVRSYLDQRKRAQALKQALECRRLVPDIRPDATVHPVGVIGALAEAEADARLGQAGLLRVRSEPPGCEVYLHGRPVGTTPLELPQLVPGKYGVQVECSERQTGRVHRLTLKSRRIELDVDPGFEQALHQGALRYAQEETARTQRRAHALEVARLVRAAEVLVVWLVSHAEQEGPLLQVDRFRLRDGKQLAAVRLELADARRVAAAPVTEAAEKLLDGRFDVDPESEQEAEQLAVETRSAKAEPAPPAKRARPPTDTAPPLLGWVLAGAGVAAQLGSWWAHLKLQGVHSEYSELVGSIRNQTNPDLQDQLRWLEGRENQPRLLGGLGAGLVTASLPLWLPHRRGVPALAWLSGAVGVGLFAAGALLTYNETYCEKDILDRCTRSDLNTHFGSVLLLQSVPLLAVPIVYALRSDSDREQARGSSQLRFVASLRGALLLWSGRL